MSILLKSKKSKVIIFLLLLIGLFVAIFIYSQHTQASGRYYYCKYKDGSPHARCVQGSYDVPDCYSYYMLRGKNIHEGIVITGVVQATCEGFVEGNEVHFNKQGNFVD